MAYDEPLAHTEALRKALQTEDYEKAFQVLKSSEDSANAHPIDLIYLAAIYDDQDIPNPGTKRERALKFWELSIRAALTGYEPAVIELINDRPWPEDGPKLVLQDSQAPSINPGNQAIPYALSVVSVARQLF